jgi:methionyl-tRNA synthetase
MNTVLHILAVTLRGIGVVLQPFMPAAMEKLLDYLGVGKDRSLSILDTPLVEGAPLPTPSGLFPRVVEAS